MAQLGAVLTIRRVPTMMSLNQEPEGSRCTAACLEQCCEAPGAVIPLYTYARRYCSKPKRTRSFGDLHTVPDLDSPSSGSDSDSEQEKSFLDQLLVAQWEDRSERGLFRYDVTACETKMLPGEYGFIAQLNEGRHLKKRPTEFRVDQVLQPFDSAKFNFTKVDPQEVLFRFEQSEDGHSEFYEHAPVSASPNVVLINVSPIEYGHVLLVPRVLECLPQRIDPDSLLLALHFAHEADNPYLRLGYNSLGAFATINHLHFQAYYLNAPFPVERAPTVCLSARKRKRAVMVSEVRQYPVRALVFEGGSSLPELAAAVTRVCLRLQERNQPFNVLIADSGARVFVFPQCFAERQARGEVAGGILDTQVNPAAWEISGHMVLKRKEDYEKASQEWAWALLAEVSLDAEAFQEVKQWSLDDLEPAPSGEEAEVPAVLDYLPDNYSSKGTDTNPLKNYYHDADLATFDDALYPGSFEEDTDGVVPQLAV